MPSKHWGDPPFKVSAKASNAAKVTYTASGDCSVGGSTGIVTIKAVGSCDLTARTASGEDAFDKLTFTIRKAQTTLTFANRTIPYVRPLKYDLNAKVTPSSVALVYRLIDAGSDNECKVLSGQFLTLTGLPQLPRDCVIEVSAAHSSSQYETPSPRRATIHVGTPNINVDVRLNTSTVHFTGHPKLTFGIRESSGVAKGIDLFESDEETSDGQCDSLGFKVTPADPSPPHTTAYTAVITLVDPGSTGYTCHLVAKASPQDWVDTNPNFQDAFTLTVVK